MEIIGRIDDGFIVKVDKVELEKLTNLYYNKSHFKVGDEINVSKIYGRFEQILRNKRSLGDLRKECEKIISSVEKLAPIIEAQDNIAQTKKED